MATQSDAVRVHVRVRKTPDWLYPYKATAEGMGTYGWGDSPAEARAKLLQNIEAATGKRVADSEGFHTTAATASVMLEALYQYESDLLYPPTGDSLQRRLERVRKVIAEASAAA